MIDEQLFQVILTIGGFILTAAGGVLGWVVKSVVDRQEKLEGRLNDHISTTSDIYARKEDINRQFDQITSQLTRIENWIITSK